MKKLLLFSLVLCFGLASFAQNGKKKDVYLALPKIDKAVANEFNFTKELNPVVTAKTVMDEDIVIGETRYDLQTNTSVQNRAYVYDDGTIGATWTMGFDEPQFPGRGTGYNYYDGSEWGPKPTERIQSARCGWPSYAPFGENGEITVAHSSDYTLIFNWRENKGEGAWNEFEFEGPEGSPGLLWPRMITSGENHDTIHLIALTTPIANGGSMWEGQDGALLYSRSADGGTTWDPENIILEGMGADYYPALSGDDYGWAEPKNGTIAFFYFDGVTDGVVMKSDDGGDSWERIEFFDFPWNGGPLPDDTERFGSGDGNNAIALDNEGNAYVVFGRQCHRQEGGAGYYYFWTNGLVYWDETLDPLDTVTVGATTIWEVPESLEEGGYLAAKLDVPFDSMAYEEYATYQNGVTSMPQITINEFDDIFISYSGLAPGFVSNDMNYRHVYGVWSFDGGETFEEPVDYTGDIYHMFSECVFPSLAPYPYDGQYHIIYQTSTSPGIALRYEIHEVIDNNIVDLPVGINVGDDDNQAVSDISYVSQNYPNPFKNQSMVQVNTTKACNLKMVITNIVGKQIAVIDKGRVNAGMHYFTIDANNLTNGVYFYTIFSGDNAQTRKMIVE